MANAVLKKFGTKTTLTLTLATPLTNGNSRQSTMVANSSNYEACMLYIRIKSGGTGPTAGSVYSIYLLRGDDASSSTYRTDAAGASDAAITIENALLIGQIVVTNTANKNFYVEIDTKQFGPLGPEWGIAIKNSSGQSPSTTEGDHLKEFAYYYDEIQ